MTIQDIKKISIREYLEQMGVNPIKENNRYGMYHSPFREDKDASMKVDYNQNLWIDYGTGEGGSIIDLVMRIDKSSLNETIAELNKYDNTTEQQLNSLSFHGTAVKQEPAIKIEKILPLTNPALIAYLKERGISIDISQEHCSEVHYSVADKAYFAIGFRNDTGGYELRNKYFKGSTTPKNITTINNNSDAVMVFEGFMDFLSYLSMKQNPTPKISSAILNSITNLSKAIPFLQTHRTIHAFFDNDEAGKRAFQCLRPVCKEVIDQSVSYRNHKDLNEYWQEKSKQKNPTEKNNAAFQFKRQIPVKKKGRGL